MEKNKLIVLCGHVGCGKSTLISEFVKDNPDFQSVDVFNFIQKYKDDTGYLPPSASEQAYRDMYRSIQETRTDLILELGINHSNVNFQELGKLKERFDIKILFCLLDKDTCLERVYERQKKDPNRKIHPDLLEAKFKMNYPEIHSSLAEKYEIPFEYLDMNLEIQEKIRIISD